MKCIQKIFVASIAFLSLFALVACKQDVDNSVATYSYTNEDSQDFETYSMSLNDSRTITFYNDNTWIYHISSVLKQTMTDTDVTLTAITNIDFSSGTYTGDPTTDGEIVITPTKMVDLYSYTPDYSTEESQTITITNSELPLEDLSSEEQEEWKETITIEDGKMTSGGFTFTRQ